MLGYFIALFCNPFYFPFKKMILYIPKIKDMHFIYLRLLIKIKSNTSLGIILVSLIFMIIIIITTSYFHLVFRFNYFP